MGRNVRRGPCWSVSRQGSVHRIRPGVVLHFTYRPYRETRNNSILLLLGITIIIIIIIRGRAEKGSFRAVVVDRTVGRVSDV